MGPSQEASTAPALPPPPRTWMQQHFLIIFFTADPWWGLQGKERKLLECWEWEWLKGSPYAHWGQGQESGPKLAKNVCLICINFCSREAGEWSKDVSSPHKYGALMEIPSLDGSRPSFSFWPPQHRSALALPKSGATLYPFTGQCRGKTSSQRIFPRVRMCTPTLCLLRLPGHQGHWHPAAVKCQKLN